MIAGFVRIYQRLSAKRCEPSTQSTRERLWMEISKVLSAVIKSDSARQHTRSIQNAIAWSTAVVSRSAQRQPISRRNSGGA
jgi:hypothetical protein